MSRLPLPLAISRLSCCSLLIIGRVWAYAEPPTLFRVDGSSSQTTPEIFQLKKSLQVQQPSECGSVFWEREGIRVDISVDPEVVKCADIRIRSAHGAAVWYYEIPPPAGPLALKLCSTTGGTKQKGGEILSGTVPWSRVSGAGEMAEQSGFGGNRLNEMLYDNVKTIRVSAIAWGHDGRALGEEVVFALVGDDELSGEDTEHIATYLEEEEEQRKAADAEHTAMTLKHREITGKERISFTTTMDRLGQKKTDASQGHGFAKTDASQGQTETGKSLEVASTDAGGVGKTKTDSSSSVGDKNSNNPLHRPQVLLIRGLGKLLPKWADIRDTVAARSKQALESLAGFSRPNGMNEHGVILREIGIDLLEWVRQNVLPAAQQTFPEWGMFTIDRWHAFTLHYGGGRDEGLDMHMDGAEVTFNACLETSRKDQLLFGQQNGIAEENQVVTVGDIQVKDGVNKVDWIEDDLAARTVERRLRVVERDSFEKSSNALLSSTKIGGFGASSFLENAALPLEEDAAFLFPGQHTHGVKNFDEGDENSKGTRTNLVIRLLSTEFRRSPATGYYLRCLIKKNTSTNTRALFDQNTGNNNHAEL
ncbi:unnamed protein product [Amoebophrya sp. A25]|nr:unnamed protein product [Amoebophrya sp. A25]|eukprot:GSA25T00015952001.1